MRTVLALVAAIAIFSPSSTALGQEPKLWQLPNAEEPFIVTIPTPASEEGWLGVSNVLWSAAIALLGAIAVAGAGHYFENKRQAAGRVTAEVERLTALRKEEATRFVTALSNSMTPFLSLASGDPDALNRDLVESIAEAGSRYQLVGGEDAALAIAAYLERRRTLLAGFVPLAMPAQYAHVRVKVYTDKWNGADADVTRLRRELLDAAARSAPEENQRALAAALTYADELSTRAANEVKAAQSAFKDENRKLAEALIPLTAELRKMHPQLLEVLRRDLHVPGELTRLKALMATDAESLADRVEQFWKDAEAHDPVQAKSPTD